MTKHNILFIGLDTHKEFNEVAYIEDQRGAQPIHHGRIPSSKVAIKKLIRQFESKYPSATLHFVYEAGQFSVRGGIVDVFSYFLSGGEVLISTIS